MAEFRLGPELFEEGGDEADKLLDPRGEAAGTRDDVVHEAGTSDEGEGFHDVAGGGDGVKADELNSPFFSVELVDSPLHVL